MYVGITIMPKIWVPNEFVEIYIHGLEEFKKINFDLIVMIYLWCGLGLV